MGLKLDRRTATIGSSINTRTEKHGEEDVVALDIPITQVCLSAEELSEVLLIKNAYKLLFTKKKGRPDEPVWGKIFNPLPFQSKVKGCTVNIYLGMKVLRLTDVNLSRVKIDPQSGGTTWWSFQIQCTPTIDKSIEALLEKLNKPVDIAIECQGYGEQAELPLEEEEGGEGEEQSDIEDKAPARGRRGFRADIDG